jgi:hypothetical protein
MVNNLFGKAFYYIYIDYFEATRRNTKHKSATQFFIEILILQFSVQRTFHFMIYL